MIYKVSFTVDSEENEDFSNPTELMETLKQGLEYDNIVHENLKVEVE